MGLWNTIKRGIRRLVGEDSTYPGYVLSDLDIHGVRGLVAMARAYMGNQARRQGGDAQTRHDQTRVRILARLLEQMNPYAQGILTGLTGYTIGSKGMTPEVVCRPGAHDSLRAEAQWYIDAFRDVGDWWSREREIYVRSHRDGEANLRFYSDENYDLPCGVTVRPIEPEFITPPDGTAQWSHGLLNKPGDQETIEAINVEYGPGDYEVIPARECYLIGLNKDRCEKRGRSDFTSTAPILEHALQLVQNMLHAEAIRQGILYITQHRKSAPEDLDALIASQTDYSDRSVPAVRSSGGLGTPTKLVHGVGEVHLTGEQELASAPGAEKILSAVAGLNAALLAVGRRYQMPLWMISGDANSNNSIDLGGESPYGQHVSFEQNLFSRHQRNIYWRVLEIGVDRGDLPAEVLRAVDVVVKPQQTFGARDPNKETERREKLFNLGLLGPKTFSAQEGLDHDNEQADIAEFKRKQANASINANSAALPAQGSSGATTNGVNGTANHFAN